MLSKSKLVIVTLKMQYKWHHFQLIPFGLVKLGLDSLYRLYRFRRCDRLILQNCKDRFAKVVWQSSEKI